MAKQIAIVMTEVFLRRLTPSLIPFVRRQHDFRIVSIHRPIDELRDLLTELKPSALITEWLPEVTEALLELRLPTVIADTDSTTQESPVSMSTIGKSVLRRRAHLPRPAIAASLASAI